MAWLCHRFVVAAAAFGGNDTFPLQAARAARIGGFSLMRAGVWPMFDAIISTDISGSNWVAALADQGWAVTRTCVPHDLCEALRAQAIDLHTSDKLTRAGIGRADDFTIKSDIRRDKTRWLSRDDAVEAAYLDVLEGLRVRLNRALYLGLFSYDAHHAVYEPGAFYARHVDAFKGARNRVLSTVLYLNRDWGADDGGEIVLYDDVTSGELAKIAPEFGTMVVFLSEDIPHEVLPAHRDRYSIAGWFRVNDRIERPALRIPAA